MPYQVETLKSYILSTVGKMPGITGTALADAVRESFREFMPSDYGSVNLRDFIRRNVPDVAPVGRRGMDYTYAVAQDGDTSISSSPEVAIRNDARPMELSAWKTFSNPNGVFKLHANKEDGKLCVCPPGAAPPDGFSVAVPPLSAEKHVEFARNYVDSLSDGAQMERLRQYLDKPQWWAPFYQAVQKENLSAAWNAARRRWIVAELRDTLTAAGVPVDGLEAQLTDRPRATATRSLATARPAPRPNRPANDLRSIAVTIIQNMSIAELRALRVNLGDVFDALER
jgi:hypothetical protein